ncbi:quinoprotein dehydrogenase-associated SoxYZ-like carrier [Methylobacterium sp. Leaf104]|uniref:quinoprotein dehydrogenase-associated SoxYZ-like carrier n=1 Tax=Methylobacterium TaxID=407 RepID=UPI0006F2B80C|nr:MULTISPECIES: quinoprotein dehydrogenase-associated SoxYZ-like carrier [Methylobacterium]KQP31315.1 quinoprotein dehydrogenase-associated SoxYZ-like carrier [Methylobacterium sp. Leaf104]MCI9881389.1 quinoprotein dehydrogenase-associated SoxYZ-like carrier [Methylobacterium goesingense]
MSRRAAGLTAGLFLAILAGSGTVRAAAGDDVAERDARWTELRQLLFGDRTVETAKPLVRMDLPDRANDASLVPLTLTIADKDRIKGLYLVIDDNPAPLAAHFTFGPAADPEALKLRVRVNTYTNVHAVAETKDGALVQTTQFVKASGGCSAPMGMTDAEAMKGMGDMRLKFADATPGKPIAATLMIRHPNFTGLQMNQVSREYTPARYINRISVSHGDQNVFVMEGDISISANPVINFAMLPDGKGPVTVVTQDNQGGRWEHSFDAPAASN